VSVQGKTAEVNGKVYQEGDWLAIDGSTGNVYEGMLPLVNLEEISRDMETFLGWCDTVRASARRGGLKGFDVRTNADQPEDAKRAFRFGAQGVGLCRTEHMFFDRDKLIHFRSMIVEDTLEGRKEALKNILPLQQQDFYGIFKAMEGRPVTIRLLDPPLHEFVPHTPEEIRELAEHIGISVETLEPKLDKLREANPMLGHRGCRLAVTYPEIYDMQVKAIALAAVDCVRQNIPVNPEIMIPIVVTARELKLLRPNAERILKEVFDNAGIKLPVKIGTMIEVPRAAIRSAHIAKYADFFSFGTNDLTQMTFAFSRDDVGSFLPAYLEKNVLDVDPFNSIDEDGVGFLIRYAVEQGRSANPSLKIGICGEHGGDPATIDFCYRSGVSYVSCSPFRVPQARLAGAQAVINNSLAAKVKTAAKKIAPKVKTTAIKAKSAVADAGARAAPKAKAAAAKVKSSVEKAGARAAPKAKAAAARVKDTAAKAAAMAKPKAKDVAAKVKDTAAKAATKAKAAVKAKVKTGSKEKK
jgi:pyruvate,orthophosphate dikinase